MNPYRNMSTQFNVLHEKLDTGEHSLTLTNFDSDNLARVTFSHHNDPTMDRPSRIEVDYLKSHQEGKGHARALMQRLYDRYPKSFVDWGLTIKPAATHLAQNFENRYYDRTAYQQNDDDEDQW